MGELFSESSRLYAKNYSVIEAVRAEFQREVDVFLDRVYEKIQSATAGRAVQEKSPTNRYWLIGGPQKDSCSQLMVSVSGASASRIVEPGEVEFLATAPTASPDELRALASVASSPSFSTFCKAGKGGRWSLFTGIIKFAGEDPVELVSSIAASLLLALNDAYGRASRATPVSR